MTLASMENTISKGAWFFLGVVATLFLGFCACMCHGKSRRWLLGPDGRPEEAEDGASPSDDGRCLRLGFWCRETGKDEEGTGTRRADNVPPGPVLVRSRFFRVTTRLVYVTPRFVHVIPRPVQVPPRSVLEPIVEEETSL